MSQEAKFTAEKMIRLLNGDASDFAIQFKAAALILILYEEIRSTIVDRTRSFMSDSFEIVEGEIVDHPNEKYLERIKGKSEFRACRDFHLELKAISNQDDLFIDSFAKLRHTVSHDLVRVMLDDKVEPIDPQSIAAAIDLIGKIEGWWLFNFEASIAPDEFQHLTEDQIKAGRSVKFLLISRLIERVFAEEFDQSSQPPPN